jgi:hypothetical protein
MAENGARAGAGAVAFFHTALEHKVHQIKILAHGNRNVVGWISMQA